MVQREAHINAAQGNDADFLKQHQLANRKSLISCVDSYVASRLCLSLSMGLKVVSLHMIVFAVTTVLLTCEPTNLCLPAACSRFSLFSLSDRTFQVQEVGV